MPVIHDTMTHISKHDCAQCFCGTVYRRNAVNSCKRLRGNPIHFEADSEILNGRGLEYTLLNMRVYVDRLHCTLVSLTLQ